MVGTKTRHREFRSMWKIIRNWMMRIKSAEGLYRDECQNTGYQNTWKGWILDWMSLYSTSSPALEDPTISGLFQAVGTFMPSWWHKCFAGSYWHTFHASLVKFSYPDPLPPFPQKNTALRWSFWDYSSPFKDFSLASDSFCWSWKKTETQFEFLSILGSLVSTEGQNHSVHLWPLPRSQFIQYTLLTSNTELVFWRDAGEVLWGRRWRPPCCLGWSWGHCLVFTLQIFL